MNHRTITAVFDSVAAAEQAMQALAMRVGGVRANIYNAQSGTVANLGVPAEDRSTLDEAMRRGGAVVVAEVPEAQFDSAADALEGAGSIDLDQREAEWRREGWQGGTAGTTATTGSGTAAAGAATTSATTGATAGGARAAADTGRTADEQAIPIAEERLRIGKREVAHGRVRIRSYVVETPVQEQVTLRQEHVEVERRPVDRAATGADNLFQERTLEATESAEEAVVSKETRVTGEVRLKKTAEEEARTISDKVRKTEVEIEDERRASGGTTGATRTSTTPQRGGPDRGA